MITFVRRLISISLLGAVAVLYCSFCPLLLALSVGVDVLLRRRFATARFLAFFGCFVFAESIGVVRCGALWVYGLVCSDTGRFYARHIALQRWWADFLFRWLIRIFAMRLELEGEDEICEGKFILLSRHVSAADTLLPAALLLDCYGLTLRFVLKAELRWDPCIDIVGHRLNNCFIRRTSDERSENLDKIEALGRNLGAAEGVVLYPEGTRFTRRKQAQVSKHIKASDDRGFQSELLSFQSVLPPRFGGVLALLNATDGADVVFCAHTGLEAAVRITDLINGSLINRRLRVRFWRIPAAAVPGDELGRKRWLLDEWRKVDVFVCGGKRV